MELIIRHDRMQEVEGVTAEYPYVLNRADSSRMRVPWHWHEEVEFSYVRQGVLRVSISGQSYVFRAGEGFFLNANVLHTMGPEEPDRPVLWDSHMLHPMLLSGPYKSVFDAKYLSPVLKNRTFELAAFRGETARQREILRLLQQVSAVQETPYSEFRTRNLFSDLWLQLLQEMETLERQSALPKSVDQERIQMMLAFIHRNYAEKITLEQIASSAMISKRECLRCFQTAIGKPPVAYLLEYRIQKAEQLLRATGLSVTEIAMQTGFSGSAYFAKMFRELRGMSPGQYRKEH